jgi:hypothetical protein
MRSKGTTLTAREILRREYGASRNFIAPHVIARGKLTPAVAYELAWGDGIEYGTRIYGVSVVRLHDDGTTERDYDSSACFSRLELANERVASLRALLGAVLA